MNLQGGYMKKFKLLLSALLVFLLLVGCGQTADKPGGETEVYLRRDYSAPHGERSFARVAVVVAGDKIVAANIEEYQFGGADGENVFVPNSDGDFAAGYAEGTAMYSKRVNNDLYSANMKENGGATKKLVEGYKAIEDFAKGKTVAELEEAIKGVEPGALVDAISSSTLVDTAGYVQSIIAAAKNETYQAVGKVSGNVDDIKIGFIQHAAHGKRAFADTVVAVLGDKIVAANIDEFQFLGADGNTGVPNSDKKFGENYAEGSVLASKLMNNETYSKNMADNGQSTKSLMDNYKAIQDHVVGLTVAEVEALVADNTPGEVVDAISSSTLVDTVGYLESIALAAKNLQ